MSCRHYTAIALLLLAGIVATPTANAQAFCALRDPTSQIYRLYPQATSYRSIVRSVDANARARLAAELPFSIHSREVGKHTLYLALRDGVPLGLVHVRSEPSDWGLVEIAWSIGLDMRISGFAFQRCRGRGCPDVESVDFQTLLQHRNLDGARALLTPAADHLSAALAWHDPASERLAVTVARSAVKTLAITDLIWGPELVALR
ncbi:MAG: hypothetical protein R3E77_00710 [Steroidobacteraceae bacterium]